MMIETERAHVILQPCTIHGTHRPLALTSEWHHLIPVAWQLTEPCRGAPPSPGMDQDGRGLLWDNRGVTICPTGHRNVHHWIVTMTHALAGAGSSDPAVAWKLLSARERRVVEAKIALTGLQRFANEANATLLDLAALQEWGQA